MPLKLKKNIHKFWNAGHERTLKVKRNIVYSFLIKGVGILISFLLVPLTISYVNTVQYGIWITVFSIVTWLNTFDIGLSNGLRNKLTYLLAANENAEITTFVSTTYLLLAGVATLTFAVFGFFGSFFNWNSLLGLNNAITYNIWPLLLLTLGFFCLQFILQPVSTILIARHQSYKAALLLTAGQAAALVVIYLLTKFTSGNLTLLIATVTGTPILVTLISSVYLFNTSLKNFAPRFRFVDMKAARSLLSVGGVFFIIQIGALVLYETDNIIITRMLGPAKVTDFNVAYKYFSLLTVVFAIIITPYWSAFTDAYAKNDYQWIRRTVKKMYLLLAGFIFIAGIMLALSGLFYRLWIKDAVVVPLTLSVVMAISAVTQIWTNINAYALNGIGKLRLQLILVIGAGIVNIPLSVWLVHRYGLIGTVMANIMVMLVMNTFFTRQCYLIARQKAKGIWNK